MLIIIYIHIAVCTVFFLYSHSNTWFLAFKVSFHNMKPLFPAPGATWVPWVPVLCRWSPVVWFRNVASLSLIRCIHGDRHMLAGWGPQDSVQLRYGCG